MPETFLCSVSALLVKAVLLLDALQLFVGITRLFLLSIQFNASSVIIKILTELSFKLYAIFSHRIIGEFLLMSKWYKLPFSVCLYVFRSQWSRGLRHEPSSPARTLGSWVPIPLEVWMSVCFYSVCVLCVDRGFATG
jgi:hypothetical protein